MGQVQDRLNPRKNRFISQTKFLSNKQLTDMLYAVHYTLMERQVTGVLEATPRKPRAKDLRKSVERNFQFGVMDELRGLEDDTVQTRSRLSDSELGDLNFRIPGVPHV